MHWTGVAMAEAASVSVSSVQRIWRAHGLQPHRIRGLEAVKAEWALICTAHNITKLAKAI
jgi:Transposase DDE domain